MEIGIRDFLRTILQEYAKDEFMRYIGERPYERTEDRRDYRNGVRKRTLQTRFEDIEGIEIPLGRKGGIGYISILLTCHSSHPTILGGHPIHLD